MLTLLCVLTAALAHPGHHATEDEAHPPRAPIVGVDVPRPQARLEWFEPEPIHGDGWTVVLWFMASAPDGVPVEELELYLSVSAGQLGPLVDHGQGLFAVTYTPPEIDHWAEVMIRARGLTGDEYGVYTEHSLWVLPSEGPKLVDRRRQRDRHPRIERVPVVASRE